MSDNEPHNTVEPEPEPEEEAPQVPQPRRQPDYQQGAVGGCVHCG